ncbi:hypothetical protein ACFTUC_39435 [Streptomyces sp. NPDC056944]|uniref:hypothetical protein n=1 Tax=unclassified Streptomyces TaxID=2593676 RepID=UPI0036318164
MKSPLLHAQAALTVSAGALRSRLHTLQREIKEGDDRGDSPISTVVIIVAAVAGALLIAGGLAAAYGRANGKLSGILGG